MKRRHFLHAIATLPVLSAGLAALWHRATAATPIRLGAQRRVRPSDPTWPGKESWAKLNAEVGGNLIEVTALFGACPADEKDPACIEALKNFRNPFWIGDQPAGTEVSGWLDAWAPAPSVYAIKARNAADVAAGVRFARENNLRLVVKGGGHSYQGTSNAPDSLLIWTRAMNTVNLHDAFVGKGCDGRVAAVPAVSSEAGAVWMDLYKAVTTENGRYVQGGGCTTVGVAGLIQSGGFGSFSKGFGTAAAGLLEAEIVTADGQVRTVNPCTEPDLFWAVRGGGGGTFGVVTRLTLRTHELPQPFGYVSGKIKAQSDAAFQKLIAHFMGFYRDTLFNPHWGEQITFAPDNTLEISMVSQGLRQAQVQEPWRSLIEWVSASPEDFHLTSPIVSGAVPARGWWDVGVNPGLIRDSRDGAPPNRGWWRGDEAQVGSFLHGFDSLWLPASLLADTRRDELVGALFSASRYKPVVLQFNKGLAGAPPEVLTEARQTATNPAAFDAFALAIVAGGDAPAYPGLVRSPIDLPAARRDARAIELAAAELHKIVPGAGSYVSESNYFNSDWQNAYWGDNYARLRAIKHQYDPAGLFFSHHGVGSEDWSADGFAPSDP
jgi:FAD/FMN-containing dehydrogenase